MRVIGNLRAFGLTLKEIQEQLAALYHTSDNAEEQPDGLTTFIDVRP